MESSPPAPEHRQETRGFPLRAVLLSLGFHALVLAAWEPAAPVVAPPATLHAFLPPSEAKPLPSPLRPEPAMRAPPLPAPRPSRPVAPPATASPPPVAAPAPQLAVPLAAPSAAQAVLPAPTFQSESAAAGMAASAAPEAAPVEARAPAANPEAAGLRQYRLALAAEARRFRRYPEQARRAGLAGTAEVAITVTADGGGRRAELSRSSGHLLLDAAALEMMRAAAERVEVPASLRGREFSVRLPVVFEVEDERF